MKTIPGPLTDAEIIGHLDNHKSLGPHGHTPEALEQIRDFEIWRVNKRNKAWLRNWQREQEEKKRNADLRQEKLNTFAKETKLELKKTAVLPRRGGFAVVSVTLPPGVKRGRIQGRRNGTVGGWTAYGGWFTSPISRGVGPFNERYEWEVVVLLEAEEGEITSTPLIISLGDFKEGQERQKKEASNDAARKKAEAAARAAALAEHAAKLLRLKKAAEKLRLKRLEEEKRAAALREEQEQKQRLLKSAREKGLKYLDKASPSISIEVKPNDYRESAIAKITLSDSNPPPESRYQLLSRPFGTERWTATGTPHNGYDLPTEELLWINGDTEFSVSCGTKYGRVGSTVVLGKYPTKQEKQPDPPPPPPTPTGLPKIIDVDSGRIRHVKFGIENKGVIPRGNIRDSVRVVNDNCVIDYRDVDGRKFMVTGSGRQDVIFHLTELNQLRPAGIHEKVSNFNIENKSNVKIVFWFGGIANVNGAKPFEIPSGKSRTIKISPADRGRYNIDMGVVV